ncbi:MAG: peptidylprolyl isomerase [Myxococcota bacterium]|nr:peptidylprolyl isomerase [Myxococcota bacterium]
MRYCAVWLKLLGVCLAMITMSCDPAPPLVQSATGGTAQNELGAGAMNAGSVSLSDGSFAPAGRAIDMAAATAMSAGTSASSDSVDTEESAETADGQSTATVAGQPSANPMGEVGGQTMMQRDEAGAVERNPSAGENAMAGVGANVPMGGRPSDEQNPASDEIFVQVTTRLGAMTFRLFAEEAPLSVANFLAYVDAGFYDGEDGRGATTFHRVIPNFMVQGGGVLPNGERKVTLPPISNESTNGILNTRGTVAFARTMDPDSATSQFFVNVVDNAFLNRTLGNAGYAVFAEVVEGMTVADSIAMQPRQDDDVPIEAIVIERMERVSWPR